MAPDISPTRLNGCLVVQLSRAHHSSFASHQTFPSTELAQTLACRLILSRIGYFNAVLHGAPTGTILKLQQVQDNAARIVLQTSRQSHAKPLLHQLHWLPVQQLIAYKLTVLTYKVRSTSIPVYLHDQITERVCSRTTLRSSAISRCWSNRSPGQTFPGVLSDIQHRLPGTRCHIQL